jgi:deoxyadenosine/deoxycytidine kinase
MIIAISGKTGVGKTTLAHHLAEMLPATVLSANAAEDMYAALLLVSDLELPTGLRIMVRNVLKKARGES